MVIFPKGRSGVLDAGLASFLGCQQGYLSPGVGIRAAEYDLVQQLFADDVPGQAVQEIGGHCPGIWVDLSDYAVRRVGRASQCVWHAVQVEPDGPAPDGPTPNGLALDNSLQVLSGQFSLELVDRMGGEVADGYLLVLSYHNCPSWGVGWCRGALASGVLDAGPGSAWVGSAPVAWPFRRWPSFGPAC